MCVGVSWCCVCGGLVGMRVRLMCVGVSWCCCGLCVWGLVGAVCVGGLVSAVCVWLMCVGVSWCCVWGG